MVLLFGRFSEYSCFVTKIFCSVFVRTEHGIPKFGNMPNTEDFCSYEEHGMTPQGRYHKLVRIRVRHVVRVRFGTS